MMELHFQLSDALQRADTQASFARQYRKWWLEEMQHCASYRAELSVLKAQVIALKAEPPGLAPGSVTWLPKPRWWQCWSLR